VNPIAQILSAGMMLEHLELPRAGKEIERAVAKALAGGKARTADLGGNSRTQEVTDAVLEAM
jgi:isocitrate/isopropylmalate dehydrogenase